MLTRADLLADLVAGEKPCADWRIGVEHEKFLFRLDSLRPLRYAEPDGWGVREVLLEFAKRHSEWQIVWEAGEPIALTHPLGRSITLEPGGQIELSGAPLQTVRDCCQETSLHHALMNDLLAEQRIGMLALGILPLWDEGEMPWMPKARYGVMRQAMDDASALGEGYLGRSMMTRTATVQCNLDYSDETDMVKKMRVAVAVQPLVTILFANSPVAEGQLSHYETMRAQVWRETDRRRTGMPMFVFDRDFGYQHWIDYAAAVPMYFREIEGHKIPVQGSFADLLAGKLRVDAPAALLDGIPQAARGQVNAPADLADWQNQLTFVFPEVRLKRYIEMRGADSGPWRILCSLPAFWTGLLYDPVVLDRVYEFVNQHPTDVWLQAHAMAPTARLDALLAGKPVRAWLDELLAFAQAGLGRRYTDGVTRGIDEGSFLVPLQQILGSGLTQADVARASYVAAGLENATVGTQPTEEGLAAWRTFYEAFRH